MKKKLLVITLLLAGHAGTTQCAMGLMILAKKSGETKTHTMATDQQIKVKATKDHNLVSDDPSIASAKHHEGKTHIVTAHKPGKTFLEEIEGDIDGFFAGIDHELDGDTKKSKKNKKRKGVKVEVAQNKFPKQMEEGDKLYVAVNKGDEFDQDNKNYDGTGRIITKHITLKGFDESKHHVVRLHAKDDGKNEAHLLNSKTGETHHIMVHEKDNKEEF